MNVHEHQLRSLTVCRCWVHGHRENLAASPGRRSLLQGARPSSTSTRSESHAFQANREEHLIILTCDHVALMRPSETEASDQLVRRSDSSWSVASSSTNEQHQQALVLSISLSQITSIELENGGIVLQYVPNMAGPSKPCGATTYEAQSRAGSPQFPVLGALVERARSVFSKDEISKRNQLRSASASSPRPSSGDGDDPAAVVRTLVLDTETQEDAEELATAIRAAAQRLVDALLWLDKGLPFGSALAVSVVSIDFASADAAAESDAVALSGLSDGLRQYILARGPPWGSEIGLPLRMPMTMQMHQRRGWIGGVLHNLRFWLPTRLLEGDVASPLSAHARADELNKVHLDMSTPIGPAYAVLTKARLVHAVENEHGHLIIKALPVRTERGIVELQGQLSSVQSGSRSWGRSPSKNAMMFDKEDLGGLESESSSLQISATPAPVCPSSACRFAVEISCLVRGKESACPLAIAEPRNADVRIIWWLYLCAASLACSLAIVPQRISFSAFALLTCLVSVLLVSLSMKCSAPQAVQAPVSASEITLRLLRAELIEEPDDYGDDLRVAASTDVEVPLVQTSTEVNSVPEQPSQSDTRIGTAEKSHEVIAAQEALEAGEEGSRTPAPHSVEPKRDIGALDVSQRSKMHPSAPIAKHLSRTMSRKPAFDQQTTRTAPQGSSSTAVFGAGSNSLAASEGSNGRVLSLRPSLQGATTISVKSGSKSIVNIGAPTFRRVLSTTADLAVMRAAALSMLSEEKDGNQEDYGPAQTDSIRFVVTASEAKSLASLAARSPVATSDLFARYVAACSGDRDRALQRLRATVQWRCSHDVDRALTTPVPRFLDVKAAYRHGIVGRDRWNRPVVVEGIGGFKAAMSKFRAKSIGPEDVIHQFIFIMEFMLGRLAKGEHPEGGQFVRIYDFKGLGMFDIADKEAVAIGQELMRLLEMHYPERMARAFVVNVPGFFPTVWKMVRPMLDPRTAEKISVVSSKRAAYEALKQVMDDEVIPVEYGGQNKAAMKSQEEKALADLAAILNKEYVLSNSGDRV